MPMTKHLWWVFDQSLSRAPTGLGRFSEPVAGRLSLTLRRLVRRHTPCPIFIRLRCLIFLIAFLSLRNGDPLVEARTLALASRSFLGCAFTGVEPSACPRPDPD